MTMQQSLSPGALSIGRDCSPGLFDTIADVLVHCDQQNGQEETLWHLPETLRELDEAGDETIVLELIDSFQSDTASRFERLHDAVARLDAAAVKAEAHAMRGSARQMGAEPLADLCQIVEAGAPQMNWLDLQRQLEQADLRFAEVRKAMSEYVEARSRTRCCGVSDVRGGRGQAAAGRNGSADGAACANGAAAFRTRP